MTDKQQIQSRISELLTELKVLSSKCVPLREKKEQLVKERNTISAEIKKLILEIKPLREQRNALTAEVKTAKEERSKLTGTIKEKIGEFKTVSGEKPVHGESPGRIKHEIERIEYKIETEGLSFEKEKQLMKVIHELSKKLKEAQAAQQIVQKVRQTSGQIDTFKHKADEIHGAIQTKAKESQEKHEKVVSLSKKIDELRKKYAETIAQLDLVRKELASTSAPWKEKQTEVDKLRLEIGEAIKENKVKSERNQKKMLEDKQKEVQEKLKKGEKLTTEDLIVLQSLPE